VVLAEVRNRVLRDVVFCNGLAGSPEAIEPICVSRAARGHGKVPTGGQMKSPLVAGWKSPLVVKLIPDVT
jgi:hypothetical protein